MAEKITLFCEVITFLGQGYCLYRFLSSFLVCRFPGKKWFAVTLSWGLTKIALFELLPFGQENLSGLYKLLLQGLLLLLIALCFYSWKKRNSIFLLVTFLSLSEISFFLGYMAMTLSTPILEWEVQLFVEGYIKDLFFERMLRVTAAALQVLCCVLWVLLLGFSLRKVERTFREKEYEMHRTELLFVLTPSLVGLLLCVLLRIIMVTVEAGMPALLYDRYPILQLLIPAILSLAFLSILYSVKLFQDMISLNRERSSRIILEQQVDTLQEHTREMERLYRSAQSVKHDIKNTLAVLARLSDEEAARQALRAPGGNDGSRVGEEYSDYLAQLNRSFEKLELRFRTGNAVADALLNMKYHEAVQEMPDLEFQADSLLFLEDLAIHSYDIGVILGNALDNAIEACLRLKQTDMQAKPMIRLTSFQRGKFFFLEVENSFDGALYQSKDGEFPETMKGEKQMHGIGFSNMKKTAEKYDGGVDYSVCRAGGNPESGKSFSGYSIFRLSVMMKNERRKESK